MTEQNEFKDVHARARAAWAEWIKTAKELQEAQEKNYALDAATMKENHAKLRDFIGKFKAADGYKRDSVQRYLEEVYDAVFKKRRQRTLELGKYSATGYSGEFKEKRLCIGVLGFAYRYEYSTHAQAYSFESFVRLLKKPEELAALTTLLQNAKQHEIAMNVVQFAKLLETQDTFGDGIVAKLETPISIPHEFGSNYSRSSSNALPRIAERIELERVSDDSVEFNLFAKAEKLDTPVVESDRYGEADESTYETRRIEVTLDYEKHSGREALLQMQLWMQFDGVNASMQSASEEYRRKFTTLKSEAEAHFGRYMLMAMVSK